MSSGSLDSIIQDLCRRFISPLPEFYKRRIVVWYDEEKEFEDQIGDLVTVHLTLLTSCENKLDLYPCHFEKIDKKSYDTYHYGKEHTSRSGIDIQQYRYHTFSFS